VIELSVSASCTDRAQKDIGGPAGHAQRRDQQATGSSLEGAERGGQTAVRRGGRAAACAALSRVPGLQVPAKEAQHGGSGSGGQGRGGKGRQTGVEERQEILVENVADVEDASGFAARRVAL